MHDQESSLVRRFGILGFVCVLGITAALCAGAAKLVADALLRHEALDLSEMLQTLVPRLLGPDAFEKPAGTDPGIARAFEGLAPSQAIVRLLVYDRTGHVLWSNDAALIGRDLGHNPELVAALAGHASVSIVRPGREKHHVGFQEFSRLLELYIPVRHDRNGPVAGVVEIYRDEPGLFALLDRSVTVLWTIGAIAGAALYAVLFAIVRHGAARQHRFEAELRAHAQNLEAGVMERTAELRETRDYLRNVIDSSADAILTLDSHGVIKSVSRAAVRIFGYAPEDLIGTDARAHLLGGPHDFRALRLALARDERVQNYEGKVRAADGRTVAVDVSAALLRRPAGGFGRVGGVVVVLRDVTEIRALYEQAVQTERLATAGRLAAGVAHEVGNPLACVSALAEMLRQQTTEPPVQRALDQILFHLARIERIVRELTRLARPSRLRVRPASVGEMLHVAIGLGRHAPSARTMRIAVACDPDLPSVSVDPDRIVQVFLNLILNAADAGGELTISASRDDRDVNVVFRDTGGGIPADIVPRIFDPFFSTKADGHAGLGLFVSHETMRQHGGALLADSQPGVGATFTVRLPGLPAGGDGRTNVGPHGELVA